MASVNVDVVASVYSGAGSEGDFVWMIQQPEYEDALFIFNDNEAQFLAHQQDPNNPSGCAAGGGNAAIRPMQCASPPRAAGIPTGVNGAGYASLTDNARTHIDTAMTAIATLLRSGRYRRLIYSSDGAGGLGTGIFVVGDDVKQYIVDGIQRLAGRDAA